jgi:chromate transporter
MHEPAQDTANRQGTVWEVFSVFLRLGLTSFGGPIAHLGYYHRELVERRRWLDDGQFAQLLAICQFLPGPASSQIGFSFGLLRAGWAGALAAFTAFALPSATLLFAFATLLPRFAGDTGQAAIHGLKIVALAVVAHGVLGMSRQLCPDGPRATIAAVAAGVLLVSGSVWMQLLVVVLGALAGLALGPRAASDDHGTLPVRHGPATGWALLALFLAMLLVLPLVAGEEGPLAVAEAFYRTGALVFGGGHVVLPLLEETVVAPGWVTRDQFLAGYGAAQAIPGPLFTFSAYLGALLPNGHGGLSGAAVALVSIFLPGFLLVSGVLPLWHRITEHPSAARAVAGINAAVVGLLGAALYDPVWTSAVRSATDVAIAIVGFTLLTAWRLSALWVVLWCVLASVGASVWL